MTHASGAVSWVVVFAATLAAVLSASLASHLFRFARRHDRGGTTYPGRAGPAGDSWARASVCIANGAAVPAVAFVFTWLASQNSRFTGEVWVIPMIVSVVCVVSSSLLARSLFRPAEWPKAGGGPKPTMDEDAFDVVSRRG